MFILNITYPEIALRETLMNAFCHADYQVAQLLLNTIRIVLKYLIQVDLSNYS